jgi:uncharacterized membrane protein YhhN
MSRPILVAIGFVLLAGLLWAESTRSPSIILTYKVPLSSLFVVTALMQPRPRPAYYWLIVAGLILGLVGDVCLALPGLTTFRCGLAAFLVGHVVYILAFARLSRLSDWVHWANLFVLVVSGAVFLWLLPRLGGMLIPVTLYIVVISVMVMGAWAAFRNPSTKGAAAWLILVGALCFYASDIFVARERFVVSEFLNRLLGLPLYYFGQFLIAFSVGYVGHSHQKDEDKETCAIPTDI